MPNDTSASPQPEPGPSDATLSRRRPRLAALTCIIAVVVVVLDQLTKLWAVSALDYGGAPVKLVGRLLSFRLLYNPGAALSIANGMTWVLTIIVVVVVIVIAQAVSRIGSGSWAVALGLLLGGALGNLIDRLFREPGFARGYVVDFIDYAGWFVGNVADIAIVFAAGMIITLSLLGIGLDGRHAARHEERPSGSPS